MSNEVPLDLSQLNESKPSSKSANRRSAMGANIINGTKSSGKASVERNLTSKAISDTRIIIGSVGVGNGPQSQSKKQKTAHYVSNVNPLQRGKYGLRMLPQQVDYYQSILEDKRIKSAKESVKQSVDNSEKPQTRKAKTKVELKTANPVNNPGKYEFEIGDIVWATLPNYKTWFPALIISHMHCKQKPAKKSHTWVYWFGDHQVSEIPKSKIRPFIDNFAEFSKGTSSLTSLRMKEAIQVMASRAGVCFPVDENVASSSSSSPVNDDALIAWAKNGFEVNAQTDTSNKKTPFSPDPMNPIPSLAACYLPLDSVYQEAIKTDDRLQQIVYCDVEKSEESEGTNEIPDYKLAQIERIKKGEVRINEVCISCCCDAESSVVGSEDTDLLEHPLFSGGLCRLCCDNIKVTMYAPGPDNKNSFCTICGQLGKLAICDNDNCHRVYCLVCIDVLVGPGVHLKVLENEKWECYLCKPQEDTGLLKPRANWRFNIKRIFDPVLPSLKLNADSDDNLNSKRQIRVLSLIDGIGTAKKALANNGITIEAYFASESDNDAINIAKSHFKESITYVEKLDNLTISKLMAISPIDLVIGAAPPNESALNSSRKGFLDGKGSANTFLYFNNIVHLLRLINKDRHVFFLFENSTHLSTSQRDIISDVLMCKPVTLCANDFCQNRNRYYWSNIPGIKRPLPQSIQEKFISLINVPKSSNRKATPEKSQSSQVSDADNKNVNPNELEKLVGLEENYTDMFSLTKSKRNSLLSRSFCIPILSHLLWSLSDFFI